MDLVITDAPSTARLRTGDRRPAKLTVFSSDDDRHLVAHAETTSTHRRQIWALQGAGWRTVAAAGVLALGAAGCGGDEEDSAAAVATPAETQTPADDAPASRAGHRRAGLGHPRPLDARVRRQAAELAETLQGDGPFTVFAPTNDAFSAVGQETLDDAARARRARSSSPTSSPTTSCRVN